MLASKSYGEAILVREIRMVQVKKRKLKKEALKQEVPTPVLKKI